MGTRIRHNERSWAIVIISEIKSMLNRMNLKIESAGGESTLSVNKKRLGIILSNSWLGTDVGKKFFNALEYYYNIHAIVVSNCKRWFHNADVVGSMIILEKKKISAPNIESEIRFWLINKDVHQLEQISMTYHG